MAIDARILDDEIFSTFCELMGDDCKPMLARHLEVSQAHINTIGEFLAAKNFKVIREAAHPLRSSSLQIGAHKVATLAGQIESLSLAAYPDSALLKDLLLQLIEAQQDLEQALMAA